MAGPNYLLGFGQRLIRPISLKSTGRAPTFPWTFEDARKRLAPKWQRAAEAIDELPDLACPEDRSVVSFVLHPKFLARSYYPATLLRDFKLRAVGSRSRKMKLDDDLKTYNAPELFLTGKRSHMSRFADQLGNWHSSQEAQNDLRKILEVSSLDRSRLRTIALDEVRELVPLEVVLHASDIEEDEFIIEGFRDYAKTLDVKVDLDARMHGGGLCFLPLRASSDVLGDLTDYSFVRAIRKMPALSLNESILRTSGTPGSFPVTLPDKEALNKDVSVAIFDGGIPLSDKQLSKWVTSRDAPGVGAPVPVYEAHGLAVTSALLFGPLQAGVTPAPPFANVHHWRVLDRNDRGDDFELVHVLRRILNVLKQRKYDFVSLSIGPALAIEDDPVNLWTSVLDDHLWSAGTVLTTACGNTGEDDWVSGNARIQPSSDGVNAVGVGAATTRNEKWLRAPYSSVGPGRSPGFIKPDLVAFGGCEDEPFWLLDAKKPGFSAGRMGTSYAAPYASRSGIGIRAHFGGQLGATAIKALMVHHSERQNQEIREGWGRMPSEISDLVICPDGEVTVVYQGTLEPSQFVRFMVPVPRDPFKHSVTIKATFCIFTPVDPEDSLNYTRAGLGIVFRPTTTGTPGKNKEGKTRSVHESASFLSAKDYYPAEMALRRDAHKWETIVRDEREFKRGELDQPVFDIEHHSRAHGQSAARRTDISYALIVTLSSRQEPNLYNRVLAAYPNVLEIMNPAIQVQVRR